jgi:hypothetical protein
MSQKKYAEDLVQEFMNVNSNKMSDDSRIEYPTAKACALITIKHMLRVGFWSEDSIYNDLLDIKNELELL